MSNEEWVRNPINTLAWNNATKLLDLVNLVRMFAMRYDDVEDRVVRIAERMEDLFEGKIGPLEYHRIIMLLRGLVVFCRENGKKTSYGNDDTSTYECVVETANAIVQIVQGDNKMDKNKQIAMVYRRVIEAMNKAEHGAVSGYGRGPLASDIAEDTATRIVEDVFGGGKIEPSEFVDKFYTMDPETEDVLHNGTLVVDGMKILIENPIGREEIRDGMEQVEIYDAKKSNRWATVTESRVLSVHSEGSTLSFVALYDDGVKMRVDRPISAAWIVKKDSIPRTDYLIHNEEGYIHRQGPTAQMVEDLKNASAAERERYRVQTGKDGDILTIDQYLSTVGVTMAESPEAEESTVYEVIAKDSGPTMFGQKHVVLRWLATRPEHFLDVAVVLNSAFAPEGVKARKFLHDNGLSLGTFTVYNEEGASVFEGRVGQIIEWTRKLSEQGFRCTGYEICPKDEVAPVRSLEEFVQEHSE